MYFDRFDICEAFYVYSYECSFVRASMIRARLYKCKFNSRPSLRGREDLTDNGRAIYDALMSKRVSERI